MSAGEVSENSSRAAEWGCPPARYLRATRYPTRYRAARYRRRGIRRRGIRELV